MKQVLCYSHLQMKNGSIENKATCPRAPVSTCQKRSSNSAEESQSPASHSQHLPHGWFVTHMASSVADFYRIAMFLTVIVLLL